MRTLLSFGELSMKIIYCFFLLLLLVHQLSLAHSIGLHKKAPNSIPKASNYGTRPRGVAFHHASLYSTQTQQTNFTCFNGQQTIPLSWINDDYCDCMDGSDEPGTSACSMSTFHCLNRGYKPIDIPSSRVNDHICDCCDGSDEWNSAVNCANKCDEEGAKWREELQKKVAIVEKGYAKRIELIEEGKKIKLEKEKIIDELHKKRDELIIKRDQMESTKKDLEERESQAKEAHRIAWQQENDRKNERKILALFSKLDINGDQIITIDEMKTFKEFDSDNNGEVSDDEAKDYLSGVDSCDVENFKKDVYRSISMLFSNDNNNDNNMKENHHVDMDLNKQTNAIEQPGDESDDNDNDNDKEEEEKESTLNEQSTVSSQTNPSLSDNSITSHYDDDTKKLIAEADQIRSLYNEIVHQIDELDSSIRDAESYISGDFGEDAVWASLKGNCYEFDDNQYIYKLCLFDKVLQKEKNTNMEINLGNWNGWIANDNNKYDMQLYNKGQQCWNGPERSTRVSIQCGELTQLIEANEPSKCEYHFLLLSPASCQHPSTINRLYDEF